MNSRKPTKAQLEKTVLRLLEANKILEQRNRTLSKDPEPIAFTLRELLYIYQSSGFDFTKESLTRQDQQTKAIMRSVYEKAFNTLRPWLNNYEMSKNVEDEEIEPIRVNLSED